MLCFHLLSEQPAVLLLGWGFKHWPGHASLFLSISSLFCPLLSVGLGAIFPWELRSLLLLSPGALGAVRRELWAAVRSGMLCPGVRAGSPVLPEQLYRLCVTLLCPLSRAEPP